MKIAIVTESSSAAKNPLVEAALKKTGHEIINLGMYGLEGEPAISYIDTGFIGALLLNTGCVDFIVGGCGTGQGFVNAIVQYPRVVCGLISEPLDAWLYAQINGGNSISLALNKGFGWAGDVNLDFVFEKLFSVEFGIGYPEHRKEVQSEARKQLASISEMTHLSFGEILERMDKEYLKKILEYPSLKEVIEKNANEELASTKALIAMYNPTLGDLKII